MPSFRSKSPWKAPQGNDGLGLFLSQIEREVFEIPRRCLGYSNFSKEEWKCMWTLANNGSIVIRKQIRQDQVNLLVYGPNQRYIKQKPKKNITIFWPTGFFLIYYF